MRKIIRASLQRKMGGLFLAFFLLLFLSLGVVSWGKSTQQQNDLLINLADRQQILIRQITREAWELEENSADRAQHFQILHEAADTFELTMLAMIEGGPAPYLPGQMVELPTPQNPAVVNRLHQVHHTWDTFREYLNVISAGTSGDPDYGLAIQAVDSLSEQLIDETNAVTALYKADAAQAAIRLRWIQVGLLVVALGLMTAGFLVMQRSVTNPLLGLINMADRLVEGDLNTPVKVTGPREIEAMAHSLDTLRVQLKSSQAEMTRRAEKLERRVVLHQHELVNAVEFSRELVADLDLEQLVSSVVERTHTLMQAHTVRLCLVASNGKTMKLAAIHGDPSIVPVCQQPNGTGLVARVISPEGGSTADVNPACAGCLHSQNQNQNQQKIIGQSLVAPLHAGDRDLGALCAIRLGSKGFDEDETRAMTFLANSAAVAIANAWLVESGRRQAEQMTALVERERLAADLHDHVAQTLSILNLKAEHLQGRLTGSIAPSLENELAQLRSGLNAACEEIRSTLMALRQPAATGELSVPGEVLVEELSDFLKDFQRTSGLQTDLTVATSPNMLLSPEIQQQSVNLVREALTNVWRHARAQQVKIKVEQVPEPYNLQLTVQDDGCGFDPASDRGASHLGLTIMRTRAEQCGGEFFVDSALGRGTRIVARFPLSDELELIRS